MLLDSSNLAPDQKRSSVERRGISSSDFSTLDLLRTFDAAPTLYFILDISKWYVKSCNYPAWDFLRKLGYKTIKGRNFYELLMKPKFTAGDFYPLLAIVQKLDPHLRTQTFLVMNLDEVERHFEMAAKLCSLANGESAILVSLQDVTAAFQEKQYLDELFKACNDLHAILDDPNNRGLSRDELGKKLEKPIKTHFKKKLRAATYEVRLYLPATKELELYLTSEDPELPVYKQPVIADPSNQGITGFVACSRETYPCDDVSNDSLYKEGGIKDARSSITSPILNNGELLGVVNIESREPNAFTKRDREALEFYCRELGRVLKRTRVLDAEKKYARDSNLQDFRRSLLDGVTALSCRFKDYASRRPSSEVDKLQERAYLRGRCEAFRESLKTIDSLSSQSSQTPPDAAKFAALKGRRVLLVDRDLDFLHSCLKNYAPYGLVADVATNSAAALEMIHMFEYDLVVCELFPDGQYLSQEEAELNLFNQAGLAVRDIHLPDYWLTNPLNPLDQAIRKRVLQEIAAGKLDAYFLYATLQEKEKLPESVAPEFLAFRDRWHSEHPRQNPVRSPEFLFVVKHPDGMRYYDGTHVLRELCGHFQLNANRITVADIAPLRGQLTRLMEAVCQRDA